MYGGDVGRYEQTEPVDFSTAPESVASVPFPGQPMARFGPAPPGPGAPGPAGYSRDSSPDSSAGHFLDYRDANGKLN